MADIQHPWQSGPTELISYALDHLHREGEFNQRIAFLLLDVGVEMLFKTFLTLPSRTTGARSPFNDRRRAAEGNFHELCEAIVREAGPRLRGIDIAHVQFFHDLRNQLYHQGNGIAVPPQQVRGYAKLSVDLLYQLLGIDLDYELRRPEIEAQHAAEEEAKRKKQEGEVELQVEKIAGARRQLAQTAAMAIEKLYPQLCVPSFVSCFKILQFLGKRKKEAKGWHWSYTEEERNWGENSSSIATSEVERARAALANVAKHQDIREIQRYSDITEFYLDLVEPIVQLILGDETTSPGDWAWRPAAVAYVVGTTSPGDWAIAYRQSADYPADVATPFVYWDEDSQETVEEMPTSEEIVQAGQKWVLVIDQIRHQIETASRDPRFVPTLKPTGENKSSRATAENENPRTVLYQEFFTDLLERIKHDRPGATHASKVSPANWFWFSAGRPGFYLGWSFGRGDVLRVELTVASSDKAVNNRAFEALEKQRAEIEREIAMPLIWEPRPDNVQKLIRVTHAAKITDEQKELESAKQWAVETMVKFIDVFTPRIKKLEH